VLLQKRNQQNQIDGSAEGIEEGIMDGIVEGREDPEGSRFPEGISLGTADGISLGTADGIEDPDG
jgi:hypothetical protein